MPRLYKESFTFEKFMQYQQYLQNCQHPAQASAVEDSAKPKRNSQIRSVSGTIRLNAKYLHGAYPLTTEDITVLKLGF